MGADKRIATALSQVPVCVGVSIFGALRMLTPVGEPAAPAPALLPLAPKATAEPEGTSDDRLMAALAWFTMVILQLPIVSIIQLLSPTNKERAFQRHHAVTSLLFYAAAVVYESVFGIAYAIIGLVTLTLGCICLWPLFFVPHLLGLYYAAAGLQRQAGGAAPAVGIRAESRVAVSRSQGTVVRSQGTGSCH